MKNNYAIALCLLLAVTACSSVQEEPIGREIIQTKNAPVFYATLEQSGAADATKVYADENLKVLWNADDRITIYNRYTYGYQYAFQGITGDSAGAFLKKEDDAEFVTGNPLEHIYAVYPYQEDNKINNSGDLSITWPSPQTYEPNSFGIGANVMVSVTDDNQLRFKNVGGYLALKLYGDNVSVSSITLRGNNGEKLSGRATVTCESEANPVLSFQSASSESLRLECTSPVHLGSTAESATTFWLVVPPTDFTQGFNITVCTSDGLVFFKSTDLEYEIERNTLCRMAAVEVVPSDIVPFADDNFKAYCVENFDSDSDGEISISEALSVTAINVSTDNIESLQGVEFFENLTQLTCKGTWNTEHQCGNGRLNCLDVSNNSALQYLDCCYNQLMSLGASNNPVLRTIWCQFNQLSSLDLSNNPLLTYLYCGYNQFISLDVRNNPALVHLFCGPNQLMSLDVSNNLALQNLDCGSNQLTSLDVSNNTALTLLGCDVNQLTSLVVTNNTALTELKCGDNRLASLDVTNNIALTDLRCENNQLTSLDVTNNTSLSLLICGANQLTSLDVSNNTMLTELSCFYNQLTSLDVSNNSELTCLWCYYNPYLTDIWLKTGQTIQNFIYDSSVAQIHYKD